MEEQRSKYIKIFFLFFIVVLILNNYGCGFHWWGKQERYEKSIYSFWEKQPTPYLIKQFKIRVSDDHSGNPGSYNMFSGKTFKYQSDYRVILSILKSRLDEDGVFECFESVLKNPNYRFSANTPYCSDAQDIIEILEPCYDKGVDITPYLIAAYKGENKYAEYRCSGLRYYILQTLIKRKIKAPELIPFIQATIKHDENQREHYLSERKKYGYVEEEIKYLRFMEVHD